MPSSAHQAVVPPPPVTAYSTLPDDRRALVARARNATLRARAVLPPTVASVVCAELESFAEFGARYGGTALVTRLIAELDALPRR